MSKSVRNDETGATKYSGATAAAAVLGKLGGASKTPEKQAQSRLNGVKGGAPTKK